MAVGSGNSPWSRLGAWLNAAGESALSWGERHLLAVTFVSGLLMLQLMILVTPFDSVLREDAVTYLFKAFGVTRGDWTPPHTHFFGWSIIEAIVIKALGVEDVFRAMGLARLTSLALMSLSLFPLAYLARQILTPRIAVIAVVAFALFPPMIGLAPIAYAEPLFLLLVLTCAAVLTAPRQETAKLLIAAALAGLAYHVRPNGAFLLVVLVVSALIEDHPRRRVRVGRAVGVVVVFLLVSAPHLVLRYEAYGSPFDYGENSKYFVDSYSQVHDRTTATPSFLDFLTTHGMSGLVKKFVTNGVFKLTGRFALYLGPLWALLLSLTIMRCLFSRDDRWHFRVPLLFVFVLLGGLVLVFDVFESDRFFAAVVPFVLILSMGTLTRLLETERFPGLAVLALLLVLLAQPMLAEKYGDLQFAKPTTARPQVRDEWAHWAAQNLSGSIAIVEGGDLILLSELAAKGGGAELLGSLAADKDMFRPSNYPRLADAYQDFVHRGVDYVLIDKVNSTNRPFLREVYEPVWADRFILIKSFRSDPAQRWVIQDMDVFRVVH